MKKWSHVFFRLNPPFHGIFVRFPHVETVQQRCICMTNDMNFYLVLKGCRVYLCRLVIGMLCIMGVRRVFCIVGICTLDNR